MDTLETLGPDLEDARIKIDATREALRAAGVADHADLRAVLAQLDRIAEDLERIEEKVGAPAVSGTR